jgi:hypothetical protein
LIHHHHAHSAATAGIRRRHETAAGASAAARFLHVAGAGVLIEEDGGLDVDRAHVRSPLGNRQRN